MFNRVQIMNDFHNVVVALSTKQEILVRPASYCLREGIYLRLEVKKLGENKGMERKKNMIVHGVGPVGPVVNRSSTTACLRGHNRDNVLLGMNANLRKFQVIGKDLALEDKLDLENWIQLVFLLDILLNFGNSLVWIHVDHLDSLIRWNPSEPESEL
jgi:hypothetical protein